MKSPLWTRLTTIALLCALALAPAVLHARICYVAIGAIERSECCTPEDCCTQAAPAGPVLEQRESECRCCLDVDLDSGDRRLALSQVSNAAESSALPADPAHAAAIVPPRRSLCGEVLARAPVPRRAAAPIPLRI